MNIGRTARNFLFVGLLLLYAFILIAVDLFHNHPADNLEIFHDDCPACLWNDQNKTVDNSDLHNAIINIICSDFVSKFLNPDDDSILIYQIVIDFIRERGPPEKISIPEIY